MMDDPVNRHLSRLPAWYSTLSFDARGGCGRLHHGDPRTLRGAARWATGGCVTAAEASQALLAKAHQTCPVESLAMTPERLASQNLCHTFGE